MKGAYLKSNMRTVCRKDSRKWEIITSASPPWVRVWWDSEVWASLRACFFWEAHTHVPQLHSALSFPFPLLLPFCRRVCWIGTDSARFPAQNRCLSVSTLLPHHGLTQQAHTKKGGTYTLFHRSAITRDTQRQYWLPFSEQPKVSNTKSNHNSVSMWCKSARQILCTVLTQTEQSLLVRLLVERMQTRHSAGGFRVTPSSCSVSEVLKTSQRTFLSETAGGIRAEQGRKNSGAPREKRVISFAKTKDYRVSGFSELITTQRQKKQVSFIKKDPFRNPEKLGSGATNSLQNDLLVKGYSSNFINSIFTRPQSSHHCRPDYTGKATQPPPQTKWAARIK